MTSVIKLDIDVGGTFTDIVLQLPDGEIVQAKTPSTPGEESKGVMAAIAAVGAQLGRSAEDILAQTQIINFGTTVATNAMLQSKGVAVGMITTRGFRDIVELRRGWKEVMFDIKLPPPPVIVPRRWRLGVTERIGADGAVIVPLDEQEIRQQARRLRAAGIKSIAICFLFAFINPAHERRARDIVREEHSEAGVFLSSEVMPRIREYERFSTTVVNAYLSPLLTDYLRRLTDELAAAGFRGELFVMQSQRLGVARHCRRERRSGAPVGTRGRGGGGGAHRQGVQRRPHHRRRHGRHQLRRLADPRRRPGRARGRVVQPPLCRAADARDPHHRRRRRLDRVDRFRRRAACRSAKRRRAPGPGLLRSGRHASHRHRCVPLPRLPQS